ncbi:uncharacterized protein BXZ73DRAFT_99796 [Epithele typhae]|uniref:uncharacterized protein n=1 Tax=Epithele typhae TaxID=378194 RepID=UPI002007A8FA|nr:uncharacterized protein BXZ73DRAFT_99796 [Epithele typhae]KAH9939123.1 hypothetical protein BXZ73DRAFT_99796 [Epithele typhae]
MPPSPTVSAKDSPRAPTSAHSSIQQTSDTAPLPEDTPSSVTLPPANVSLDKVCVLLKEILDEFKKDGLFSAALTAFNTIAFAMLQPQSSDQTNAILTQVSSQLKSFALNPSFVNSTALAFGISMSSATIGIMVKQWLKEYNTGLLRMGQTDNDAFQNISDTERCNSLPSRQLTGCKRSSATVASDAQTRLLKTSSREFKFMRSISPIWQLVKDSAPRIRECDGIAAIQPFVAHAFSSFEMLLNTIDWSLPTASAIWSHHPCCGARDAFIQLVGTETGVIWTRGVWVNVCKDPPRSHVEGPAVRAPPPDASSSAAGPQLEKQSDQAAEPSSYPSFISLQIPRGVDAAATPHEMSTAPDAATGTRLLVSILRTVEPASAESEWDKLWENDAFQKISDAGTLHLGACLRSISPDANAPQRPWSPTRRPAFSRRLTEEFESMYKNIDSIWELVKYSAPRIRECDGIAVIQPVFAHAFSSFENSSTRVDWSCPYHGQRLPLLLYPEQHTRIHSHPSDGIRRLVTPSLVAALEHTFTQLVGTDDWSRVEAMVSRLCAGAKISSSISGRRSRRALRPMRCLPLEILNQGNTATKLRNASSPVDFLAALPSRQLTGCKRSSATVASDAQTRLLKTSSLGVQVHAEPYRPIRELVEHSAPRIRECDGIAAIQPFVAHAFSSFETLLNTIDWSLPTASAIWSHRRSLRHSSSIHTARWNGGLASHGPQGGWVGMCKDRLLDLTSKVPPCRAPPPDASSSAAGPQSEKHNDQAAEPELPCRFPVEVDAAATPHEMPVAPDAVPATSPAASMDIPRTP